MAVKSKRSAAKSRKPAKKKAAAPKRRKPATKRAAKPAAKRTKKPSAKRVAKKPAVKRPAKPAKKAAARRVAKPAAPKSAKRPAAKPTPRAGAAPRMGAASASPVDALRLLETAASGARALLAAHPEVHFTSGTRTIEAQASAMAANILETRNRRWIAEIYRSTPQRDSLQAWVDAHPEATTREALAAGFVSVMRPWNPIQRGNFSRHMSGLAFDVRPVGGALGDAIKRTIRTLPNCVNFITDEGGLQRWHAEFRPA